MAVLRKFKPYISMWLFFKCLLPPFNSLENMASNNVHGVISPTTFGSLPREPQRKGCL